MTTAKQLIPAQQAEPVPVYTKQPERPSTGVTWIDEGDGYKPKVAKGPMSRPTFEIGPI